ncbi:MAG TPA: PIG-L deacetylase family protein [Patescibacteria group bacterium]|nr:PIG-L deacetylase family protein [Patescibacteria group bacterium]
MKKTLKKKVAVGIFAHPDDEAFGPSGTIHKLAKEYDFYLLTATKGEIGKSSVKGEKPLHEIRADELRESAKILGVKKVFFLGFKDGTLSNSLYHKLAAKIEKILDDLKPELIITSNPNGGSGHIDHITVSMVSSFVFHRKPFIKKIMYSAITEEARARMGDEYFIYRPPGYKLSEIDEIIDVADVWETKLKAMQAHKSQKHDYENIIKSREGLPKKEYFQVKKK